jgi:hypothetical protein
MSQALYTTLYPIPPQASCIQYPLGLRPNTTPSTRPVLEPHHIHVHIPTLFPVHMCGRRGVRVACVQCVHHVDIPHTYDMIPAARLPVRPVRVTGACSTCHDSFPSVASRLDAQCQFGDAICAETARKNVQRPLRRAASQARCTDADAGSKGKKAMDRRLRMPKNDAMAMSIWRSFA